MSRLAVAVLLSASLGAFAAGEPELKLAIENHKFIPDRIEVPASKKVKLAFGAERISHLAEGMGQELFNATILGIAVVMLAWHNIWMSVHGRELAANAKRISGDIATGAKELSVLLVVIAIAVLREGSETVL